MTLSNFTQYAEQNKPFWRFIINGERMGQVMYGVQLGDELRMTPSAVMAGKTRNLS